MKKWLKITAIVLVCLVGIWCGLLSLQKEWITPLPGVRMTPRLPILREEDIPPGAIQELFFQAVSFSNITNEFPGEEQSAIRKQLWDNTSFSNLSVYLDAAQTNLALATKVGQAGDMQVPSVMSFFQPMSHISGTRQLVRIWEASAKRKAGRGDIAGACEEMLNGIRFGNASSRGGMLINCLVAMACSGICTEGLAQIFTNYQVPEEVARHVLRELESIEDELVPLSETYRWEYVCLSNSLDQILADPVGIIGYGYNPQVSRALFAVGTIGGSTRRTIVNSLRSCYQHLIDITDKPDPTGKREMEFFERFSDPRGFMSIVSKKDPIGFALSREFFGGLENANHRFRRSLFSLRACRLLLAIDQYERKNSRIPKDLEDLVPEFLKKVPLDPCDGEPLRYKIRKDGEWLIYSVGKNRLDDGGVGNMGGRGKDTVFTKESFFLTTNAPSGGKRGMP